MHSVAHQRESLVKDLHATPTSSIGSASSPHPDNCDNGSPPQQHPTTPASPRFWRVFAFLCIALIGFGSHFSANVIGALKVSIKENLGINNAKYGVLQATVSLVNTVIPILGGRYIDTFGVLNSSLVSCTFIMTGSLLLAVSAHLKSFVVMVLGRFLYGLGSTTVILVQHAILSHWFRGTEFALVVGIQLATSRLASYLATLLTVPIKNALGWYGYVLWVTFALCFVSWLINVVYVVGMVCVYDPSSGDLYRPTQSSDDDQMTDQCHTSPLQIPTRDTLDFYLPGVYEFPSRYWLVAGLSFILASTWTAFLHIAPELIMQKYNQREALATFNASLGQLLPIFGTPAVGFFIDQYGQQPKWLLLSTISYMCCLTMIMAADTIPAYVPLILYSVSLTIGPVTIISAIGLLIQPMYIGTAFGFSKSFANIASTLLEPILGWLQDANHGLYDGPLVLLLVLVFGALGLALALQTIEFNDPGLLSANKQTRQITLSVPVLPQVLHVEGMADYRYLGTDAQDSDENASAHNGWHEDQAQDVDSIKKWYCRLGLTTMAVLMVLGWILWILILSLNYNPS